MGIYIIKSLHSNNDALKWRNNLSNRRFKC